jgi:hypothetical protein
VEDELEERDRIGNYPYHSGPDEMMSTKAKRDTGVGEFPQHLITDGSGKRKRKRRWK